MSFIYLASPYAHSDPLVMEDRYQLAVHAVGVLLSQKRWVYSPIVHNHPVALNGGLPRGHGFWLEFDFVLLGFASTFMILRLEGWRDSKGIAGEKTEAQRLSLPVEYMDL